MNTELEDLLEEFFKDPTKEDIFYAKLLSSELFVLTLPEKSFGAKKVVQPGEKSIAGFTMENGTLYTPVFTSLQELNRSIETEYGWLAMAGWNLFSLTKGADIVINPAGDHGLHLKSSKIESLLENFSTHQKTLRKGRPFVICMPHYDPVDLKKALSVVFERDIRVQAAYLCAIVYEEPYEYAFLVSVVFRPDEEYGDLFNLASIAARPFLPKGYFLEFMTQKKADGFGDKFFSRKSGAPAVSAPAEEVSSLAAKGNPEAQFSLGLSYMQGQGGVKQDYAEAYFWLTLSAAAKACYDPYQIIPAGSCTPDRRVIDALHKAGGNLSPDERVKSFRKALNWALYQQLKPVADHGLFGGHHYWITFKTGYLGVVLSKDIRKSFPEEMTIVLQHDFSDLYVEQDKFSVTLSFNKKPEQLVIPFDSVVIFADPSTYFSLEIKQP